MGHPRMGQWVCRDEGGFAGRLPLPRGFSPLAFPLSPLHWPSSNLPSYRRWKAVCERGTFPVTSATPAKTLSLPGPDLCLPRASWLRLASILLANGLLCQAAPPTPDHSWGCCWALLTPTLLSRAWLFPSTDSYLGLGHGHYKAVDNQGHQ